MMAGMSHAAPDSQIVVPESFVALFTPRGRIKPTEPWAHILARYELCEDTAQMLVEPACQHRDRLGIGNDDVVLSLSAGLSSLDSGLSEAEANWVARRLAELLEG